ncbi:DUF983 domain-containing protein [Hymenobacter jeollabukensis]|nr:DUF983 domain-containing protein [Hymenobacter jeollabukensis]
MPAKPADSSAGLALLRLRCPRCHAGPLFTHSALSLTKFDEMPDSCPVCGQHYEPETGFYWGAMYISYGLAVGVVFVAGMLTYFLGHDPATWVYVSVVAACMILLTPLLFRYARALMLYGFGGIRYDPMAAPRRSA